MEQYLMIMLLIPSIYFESKLGQTTVEFIYTDFLPPFLTMLQGHNL